MDNNNNVIDMEQAYDESLEKIFELLEEKGCRDGDTVSMYDFEFDYVK